MYCDIYIYLFIHTPKIGQILPILKTDNFKVYLKKKKKRQEEKRAV